MENNNNVLVTPFTTQGKFTTDVYDNLIHKFGVSKMSFDLVDRFVKLTGKQPHRLLRRNLFFAHRDFDRILDDYEKGNPIYIYTGRGPSTDRLHLGHILPLEFTVWIQQALDAFVVIQIADDEKFWFKDLSYDEINIMAQSNINDILSLGFNKDKTFIFGNNQYCNNNNYKLIANTLMKHISLGTLKQTFGLNDSSNIGQMLWPIYQTIPCYYKSMDIFKTPARCLVIYAIDQDPYFRIARDYSHIFKCPKPSALVCKFLPSLRGQSKMSSTQHINSKNLCGELGESASSTQHINSKNLCGGLGEPASSTMAKKPNDSNDPNTDKPVNDPNIVEFVDDPVNSTIFLGNTYETILNKINKYGFSGGKDTLEEHKRLGGDCSVDASYILLEYFLEDDVQLTDIHNKFTTGELLSSEIKKIAANCVFNILDKFKL